MADHQNYLTGAQKTGQTLEIIGGWIIRYGVVVLLLWIGLLKFTAYEAKGIQGLVENSPFMAWGYHLFSTQGYSIVIGMAEIIFALLIAVHPMAPQLSVVGSAGVVIMSLVTLSFMFTTPGMWQSGYGFPFLSGSPGQFLLKDLLLLGGAVWTAGEALSS